VKGGGGLSGLGAAYYFLKNVGRDARVLVLDNHDDFGGHAKRNEFHHNGKVLALNGGTLNIESPFRYDKWSASLLKDIGVDLDRYTKSNTRNAELYRSFGLQNGHFFDRETWGADRLVVPDPTPAGGGRYCGVSFSLPLPFWPATVQAPSSEPSSLMWYMVTPTLSPWR